MSAMRLVPLGLLVFQREESVGGGAEERQRGTGDLFVSFLSTEASMEPSSVSGCHVVAMPPWLTVGIHAWIWLGPSLSKSKRILPNSCESWITESQTDR
jgi:hypothetical protein